MKQVKTLLACWDEATDTAKCTLGSEFVVTVVHTLDAAIKCLAKKNFDLIVATIRFDESRPMALMPAAEKFGVPVALVRFGVSQLPAELVAASFVAARSLGCKTTIDLTARSRLLGRDAAIAELRIALRAAAKESQS